VELYFHSPNTSSLRGALVKHRDKFLVHMVGRLAARSSKFSALVYY
jgi:hypothetical protein